MSNNMQEPTMPAPAHTHTPRGRPVSMDMDDSDSYPQKRSLTTMKGVSAEWHNGSKRRVVKYYVVAAVVGLLVGAIIGVVVGVCIRFT
ncbi:MAG: hypothetical protein M4579_004496 [Chaenotheca gracillima]|nr:MAG: hypothetical protein M4579_004496 [Chaenotheca gracillima]